MIKKIIILLFYFFYSKNFFSQNLVPNPSFENFTTCPTGGGQINFATPWFDPSFGNGSGSDCYNQCSSIMNVPNTPLGYQYARTGVAFAGIFVFQKQQDTTNNREYIECKLLDSLKIGKKYCIEFFINSLNINKYPIDAIGMYFSQNTITSNSGYPLPYNPQIINLSNNFLSDTLNWMLISGEYIAQGGEKYITIGNFLTNVNTNYDSLPMIGGDNTYYVIDDVSVYCCDSGIAVADVGNNKTICKGDSVTISTPAISGCSYQWQPATELSDTTSPQPKAFPQVTTTYYLTVKDTTAGSCQYPVQDSVTITVVNFLPIANAGNTQTICIGDSAVIGTTAQGGYTYHWQPFSGLNDSTMAQPTASPTQKTTYFLTVQDSGKYCPAAQDSVTVSIIEIPFADAGSDTIFCEGDSAVLGEAEVSGYKYQWQPTINLNAPTNAQTTATPQQTTEYFLTVQDSGNYCPPVQDSVLISVVNLPIADAGSDKTICKGENTNIGTVGINGYEYRWQPATGLNDTTVAQPFITSSLNYPITINYTLTVSDTAVLCPSDTDSASILVIDCDTIRENIAFLPSIFSPNGDGANDVFRVRGENIAEGELAIYNRWGEKIYDLRFTKDDLTDVTKWWNGTYKGKLLNTGVFVYFCKITFEDGSKWELKGNVTLVR